MQFPLDMYMSIPADPFTEDNSVTQSDILENSMIGYMVDSIVLQIGNDQCKYSMDMFWDELTISLPESTSLNMFKRCMNKIIEVYKLSVLEQYFNTQFFTYDYMTKLKEVLDFFEREQYVSIISYCLPVQNPTIFLHDNDSLEEFISLNFNAFLEKLKTKKESIPAWIYYAWNMMSKDDFVSMMKFLIKRSGAAIAAEEYLNREGKSV